MKIFSKSVCVAGSVFCLIGQPALATAPSLNTLASASGAVSSMAAHYARPAEAKQAQRNALPAVLSDKEREHYQRVFAAIDGQDWKTVEDLLGQYNDSALHQVATAEYYTHAKSPKVSAEKIAVWLQAGVDLPQASQLGRMGLKRGLDALPALPGKQGFRYQAGATKRIRPKTVRDGTMPRSVRSSILASIKNDDPRSALERLSEVDPQLSSASRAEWRQRVAWSFYIENDDENALALAETVSEGSGAWVAEGEWVAGLAAWRLGYCSLSAEAFARSADQSTNQELTAAAHYWAYRAMVRCREPAAANDHLLSAARIDETLYGMLAREQLGVAQSNRGAGETFSAQDWDLLEDRSNVRVAAALAEINRSSLADEVLRHEANIGSPSGYASLARLARELGLPSTQLFMAYHAPYGSVTDPSLRYPVASWRPKTGWRVDPALAFAHALQESNFRASAVSPANARGLMQIMPGTARDHNRDLNLGASYADLNDPEVNLTYGQQHLEMLRDSYATEGKLLKIMAAYNAGLTPVTRWNTEINDQDDPLLWMESIPYWETRGYVAIVMRNYWMYERAAGLSSPSRRALAQGQWPGFPAMSNVRTARATLTS
ncbi:MAG: lytic transglycosylase domain-containing protein [Pseudomonadota bacterium]